MSQYHVLYCSSCGAELPCNVWHFPDGQSGVEWLACPCNGKNPTTIFLPKEGEGLTCEALYARRTTLAEISGDELSEIFQMLVGDPSPKGSTVIDSELFAYMAAHDLTHPTQGRMWAFVNSFIYLSGKTPVEEANECACAAAEHCPDCGQAPKLTYLDIANATRFIVACGCRHDETIAGGGYSNFESALASWHQHAANPRY